MEKGIKTSVVIPTYNRPHLALQAAKTIRSFHPSIQITIVDQQNSSILNKKEAEKIQATIIDIETINTSLAKNRGIKESIGDIIFFFDDDIEITKDTIPSQLAEYDDARVVGTCGRVINDGEIVPHKTEVTTGKTNFMGTKFIQQFWSTKKQNIDFPYGCNMSFRKSALMKVGGFDPGFPKIFEEIDLGVRVSKNIGQIIFVPSGIAYHHKAKTGGTRTDSKEKIKMIYQHYGRYIAKYVIFPFSLVTLFIRTITAFKTYPVSVFSLWNGYMKYFFK